MSKLELRFIFHIRLIPSISVYAVWGFLCIGENNTTFVLLLLQRSQWDSEILCLSTMGCVDSMGILVPNGFG